MLKLSRQIFETVPRRSAVGYQDAAPLCSLLLEKIGPIKPVWHFHHLWIKSSKLLSWDLLRTREQTRNKLILDHKGDRDYDGDVIQSGSSHQPIPPSLLGLVCEDERKAGTKRCCCPSQCQCGCRFVFDFECVFPLLQPCLRENTFRRVVFPVKLRWQTQAFLSLNEELCLCITLGLSGGGHVVGPLKETGRWHQIQHILTQIRSDTTAWSVALSFEQWHFTQTSSACFSCEGAPRSR